MLEELYSIIYVNSMLVNTVIIIRTQNTSEFIIVHLFFSISL
jgi:hypothetical protein